MGFTTSDLDDLPDPLDGTRYEIIGGELWVTGQPHWDHQLVGAVLGAALLTWSRQSRLGVPNIAPRLTLSPEDDVAPDLVWISRERRASALRDGKLYEAPELVVEILSPGSTNERRDRDLKLRLYARAGVEEYWIIDWRARTVEVYRRADERLVLAHRLGAGNHLGSPLLPGFAVPLDDLWDDILT